ncbi:MAG: hypothetical protein JWP44_3065 [Mucilaginibacter sp.]|nr:hypothetical protein [Mucilaginibacter sp.]
MIVNYLEKGWEIITQRAHGLLSAQIAMQWRKKDRPKRWTETVLAIADHDDAQIELEANDLLTPLGGPVNYRMKLFEADHCRRLQDFSLSKSRYIGLLSSMHMVFLHHKEAESNPEAKHFLNEQIKLQKIWRKELNISEKETSRIYALMEWCDAFSLLLCQHEVQPENRTIEISQGPDKKQYKLMQNKNGSLTVKPWPFETVSFKLHVEYRIINQLQFKNCDQFKAELLKAEVTEKVWVMEGKIL